MIGSRVGQNHTVLQFDLQFAWYAKVCAYSGGSVQFVNSKELLKIENVQRGGTTVA